jgi:hypothetical protein
MASSKVLEQRADEYTMQTGKNGYMASALAKLNMLDLYFNNEYDTLFYEGELKQHFCTEKLESFKAALPERDDFWRNLLTHQLPAKHTSHPDFRERWEKFGCPAYTVQTEDDDPAYEEEKKAFLSMSDAMVVKAVQEKYDEAQKEYYLKPLEEVQRYEKTAAEGKEYPVYEMPRVLDALNALLRNDELLSLCDKTVARAANDSEAAYARFLRGRVLLRRYDKRGIEDLYAASDGNHNFEEAALDSIGQFCLLMGLQEELEEYRRRALVIGQQRLDDKVEEIGSLQAKDRLSVEDRLPEEQQQKNIAFIREVCGENLKVLYQLKKIINEDFCSTVYVVGFYPEIPAEQIDEAIGRIFRYLDALNWQYSLFELGAQTEAFLKKIPGARVQL